MHSLSPVRFDNRSPACQRHADRQSTETHEGQADEDESVACVEPGAVSPRDCNDCAQATYHNPRTWLHIRRGDGKRQEARTVSHHEGRQIPG